MDEFEEELFVRRSPREQTPRRFAPKIENSPHVCDILSRRALGVEKNKIGFKDNFINKIYNEFDAVTTSEVNPERYFSDDDQCLGGIFNLEFSSDGKFLVAACEGKQYLLFDSANQKLIKTVENAHMNCVNCIKFLDRKTFATGSDDSLIKLWDIRNLNTSLKTLQGHSNWVKNIEWSEQEQVMVTSAFDGAVYTWNLNESFQSNMQYEKVFLMTGLMRMKLSPDGTKMIISSTMGFMIIIHNLNLSSLANDLKSFRPTLYRLMQMSEQSFPIGTMYNYLFEASRQRNRIEFIDDFPNAAEVISSLQIHPHGWCAVSRNLDENEAQEWTAVHDIQERDPNDYKDAFLYVEECIDESELENYSEDDPNQRPTDLWTSVMSNEEYTNAVSQTTRQTRLGIVNTGLIGNSAMYSAYFEQHPEEKNKVVKNLPRMTHYIIEENSGKGFIKGLSFSADGRVICSPYGNGVRLLAFSDKCQELSDCVPEQPQQLKTVVEMYNYHKDVVLSCRFSPTQYQLVSGCLGSEIKWYQPIF